MALRSVYGSYGRREAGWRTRAPALLGVKFRTARRTAATCGLCLLLAAASAAADAVYSISHFSRQHGLPQTSVRAIAVDQSGFLWLGTENGVARFDGHRFLEIKPPFSGGVVMYLNFDARNRLWIRWYGKPLTLYEPATGRWEQIAGSESIDYFSDFLGDRATDIWLADRQQLFRFDEELRRLVRIADLSAGPTESAATGPTSHTELIVRHRDTLWIAGNRNIVQFDAGRQQIVQRLPVASVGVVRLWKYSDSLWYCNSAGVFRLNDAQNAWQLSHTVPVARVSACEFANDGTLWIGTDDAGVYRIASGKVQQLRSRRGDATSLAEDAVINVQSQRDGQLWVLTAGNAHRWTGEHFERFEFSPDSQKSNPGGIAALGFIEDSRGVAWFGSEGYGLAKISKFALKARHLRPPSQINAHVRTPVVDASGNIWMGMNRDGVYRWNVRTANWTHFAANPLDESRLPSSEVRAMAVTSDGNIWASSQTGTVSRHVSGTDRWRRYAVGGNNPVFNLLAMPNGHLLVGRDNSVVDFEPSAGRKQSFPTPGGVAIRVSVWSRRGSAFLGTHQGGVLEFDPARGFIGQWNQQLSDRNVFSLYEDRLGILWIGTWGGGLNRLDPASGRVQVISLADGLPDATIFGIQPGKHDDLWVSTYAGLAHVRNCIADSWPCKPAVTTHDVRSGLPFSEFDAEAAARGADGVLWFGGLEGLLGLDPEALTSNRQPPTVQLSELRLNEQVFAPMEVQGALTQGLNLKHNFGSLKLAFSALDFHAPANNRYRYRLNRQSNWISLGSNPEVSFSSLASGRHVVEIEGTNNDGVWSERPLRLNVRVRAPWYAGTMAWLTYAALFAAAIALLFKWREHRSRLRTRELETTVAERTRELALATAAREEFYANVSHEIRTPLSLLVGTAEAIRQSPTDERTAELSDELVRHSERLRHYVDNLITVATLSGAPATTRIREDLLAHWRSALADFKRFAPSIEFDLLCSAAAVYVRSYPDALHIIFGNLLNNAIRHTPVGGRISVRVTPEPGGAKVVITDSGPGIEAALLPLLFERGTRGGTPARNGRSHGIGLALVKQTVESLGGSVVAENAPDAGARFTVTLPVAGEELPLIVVAGTTSPVLSATGPTTVTEPSVDTARRGSILIVEDHDELRTHIATIFESVYRVRTAATLADGQHSARAHLPDVVICDVLLPDGEGFELVNALKADPLTEHVSVVLLTALADEQSRLRGLKTQADLYLTKPFRRAELEQQIANLMLQRRRLRRLAAEELWVAKAAAVDSPPLKTPSFEARLLSVIDLLYRDSTIDVELLAKHLAMSRKQLERKTRYCFACSPKALLNRYRLDKAIELLRQGAGPGAVAERCGFSNQTRFGVLFKKRFGHPPGRLTKSPAAPATSQ